MGRGIALEQFLEVLRDSLLLEALVMAVELTARLDLHREQVADRPHLEGGAGRDPGQHLVQVIHGDQVRRGREHAAETLLHRLDLMAEHVGLRGGAVPARRGTPAHAVDTARGAHRLALLVLHGGRLQAEQHRRTGHQPARPRAVLGAAREALGGDRHDLDEAGPARDHLEPGHGAELSGALGHRGVGLLGRAERPQHSGDLRAGEPVRRVDADRARELRVVGDPRAGPPQGHRLVVDDPVRDVEQVVETAPAARQAQHLAYGLQAPKGLDPREQNRAHRAREVIAAIGSDAGALGTHPGPIGVATPFRAVVSTDWTSGG
jgi:hypothetical protein